MTVIYSVCLATVMVLSCQAASRIRRVASSEDNSPSPNSNVCGSFPCPRYTKEVIKGIEKRTYEPSTFVSTKVKGKSFEDSLREQTFQTIFFGYLIAKGVPVALPSLLCSNIKLPAQAQKTYTRAWYLDPNDAPYPQPDSSDVFFDTKPETAYYVKSLQVSSEQGYEDTVLPEARKFADELKALGLRFKEKDFCRAGYNRRTDDPRLIDLWFPVK